MFVLQSNVPAFSTGWNCCCSCSIAERISSLNWPRTCRVVSTPTMAANPHRITHVSTAEPPANRHRIGSDLYAENVARAADRV